MTLIVIYLTSGTVFFISLFMLHIRKGLGESARQGGNIFHSNLMVNRKLLTDLPYAVTFLGLMIGLFLFAASVLFLIHHHYSGASLAADFSGLLQLLSL